jgi:hypothetical protein
MMSSSVESVTYINTYVSGSSMCNQTHRYFYNQPSQTFKLLLPPSRAALTTVLPTVRCRKEEMFK